MTMEIISANQQSVMAQQATSDDHLIDLFIRRKRSANTQRTYRLAVDQFLQFIDHKSLQSVNLDDMVRFTEHLEVTYSSKHSQRLKLDAVRSLFTFAQKVGYLQFNVGAAVEAPKPENTLAGVTSSNIAPATPPTDASRASRRSRRGSSAFNSDLKPHTLPR